MKILIIEDEEDILDALARGFSKLGYAVNTASDGKAGCDAALEGEYDVIILDLNLPSMDGVDILTELRKNHISAKVIILSARTSYAQRIAGLDLGADDYLVKPFDFGELEARVRNLLRRDFSQAGAQIKVGELDIDTARRIAIHMDKQIDLSPKEYRILEYMAINSNRAISAEELIEHVWADEDALFSNSIKVHISSLRKKMSAVCGKDMIRNIRGSGYILEEKKS